MAERVKDRRGAERVDANLNAAITSADAEVEVSVRNVSMSGLLILSPKQIPEMTIVSMRLVLPGSEKRREKWSFDITGAVVRCEPTRHEDKDVFELAVFFTDMPAETRSALQQFIASHTG
jgi:hypothetical protein